MQSKQLCLLFLIVIFDCHHGASDNADNVLNRLVVVVASQPNSYHAYLAVETRKQIRESLEQDSQVENIRILLAHEDLPLHGAWTFFPLMQFLRSKYQKAKDVDWFLFLDESSRINVKQLELLLQRCRDQDLDFVGSVLQDKHHTVIHHFDDPKDGLKFPDLELGFLMSTHLLTELSEQIEEHGSQLSALPSDFSIDPAYELAKVIHKLNEDEDAGVDLEHDNLFCDIDNADSVDSKDCAVYTAPKPSCYVNQSSDLSDRTLFAVKTCAKFHQDRLPVIQKTWSLAASNIVYVSEKADPEFGTTQLPGISKNTERGHCAKTMAILKHFNENRKSKDWTWLVIADDDTILSVQRILELLHCYDSNDFVALGQRYGYRVSLGTHGYDYLTGGGGMIFSAKAVEKLLEKSSHCSCPRPDTPDDMHLGACIANLGQSVVHSSRFHQARPEDYPEKILRHPVSFHKFWNTDPIKMYDKWFRETDQHLANLKFNKANPHQEL